MFCGFGGSCPSKVSFNFIFLLACGFQQCPLVALLVPKDLNRTGAKTWEFAMEQQEEDTGNHLDCGIYLNERHIYSKNERCNVKGTEGSNKNNDQVQFPSIEN